MTGPRASGSITARIAGAIALILLVGGVLGTLAALAYGRRAADEAYDKLLAGAAFQIARSIAVVDGELVVDLPVSAFEILALAPEDRVFHRVISGPGDQTLTGYGDLPAPDPATAAAAEDLSFYDAEYLGAPVRLAAMRRVLAERAFVGEVRVILAQTLRARTALARDIARNALEILAMAGAMLVALAVIAVRSSLSPLRRIERALARRDPSDLTPLGVAAPREVSAMVAAIDRFMARLAGRVNVMKNLIADATHQLRTPVAALRAQAELAARTEDPAQLRAIAARMQRRAVALSRLTDQLLNQALITHRADAAPRQEVDLRAVAIQVSEEADHDFLAAEPLRLDLPEAPAPVTGDALSLAEATKNLVNNAYRYGRAPVTLAVIGGRRPRLEVRDHGPGFDFARLGEAGAGDEAAQGRRFASVGAGGSGAARGAGLGLAIVTAVAEAHGGRLAFSRPPEGGFRAALELPGRGT